MLNDSSSNQTHEGDVSWGPWLSIAVALSAYITAILFSVWIVSFFAQSQSVLSQTILSYVISSTIIIISVYGFLRVKHFSLRRFMGEFRALNLLFVPIFYFGYFIATWVTQVILSIIPGYNSGQSQSFGLDSAAGGSLLAVLLVLVILPPIAEEAIFRGVLYRGMKTRWGRIAAALITSILFGAAHGQWNVAADTFVLSLFLIMALESTKSLYTPIALHMTKNFIAYLLVFVLHK